MKRGNRIVRVDGSFPAIVRRVVAGALLLLAIASPCAAQDKPVATPLKKSVEETGPVSAAALRRKQEVQQKARTMTRELVSGVLEIQLQQLEENGLTEMPLYQEIAAMRKNLSTLVDKEMEEVVTVLVRAQTAPDAERETSYKEARQMVRVIVTRLSIERQNLLRRLRIAELVAQVRRLIQTETKVLKQVKDLIEQPAARQEKLALVAIEDQRDFRELFLALLDTLSHVSKWDGPAGTGAVAGLRVLAAAKTGTEVERASETLEGTRYVEATEHQANVIKGLKLLLEQLEKAQGELSGDREEAAGLVREIAKKQAEVRRETQQADLTQAEPLIEKQAEIRKELGQLEQALAEIPASADLIEQAKEAAYDATGQLFEQDRAAALDEQAQVLGALAELEARLNDTAPQATSDKTAAELAKLVSDLEKAKAELAEVAKKQDQADAKAEQKPAEAAAEEKAVAEAVAKVDDNKALPEAVVGRLEQAEQAAQSAAEALANAAADANASAKEMAAEKTDMASEAVERAQAEIAATLDDAKRQAAAVEIGELARAAEALERAAAAERELAKTADEAAADKQGLTPEASRELAAEQAEIAKVAEKVAEGTKETAPQGQAPLQAAKEQGAIAAKMLEEAAKGGDNSTPEQAAQVAKTANETAKQLADAAKALREEIGATAKALIAESDQQLAKIDATQDKADAAAQTAEGSLANQLAQVEAAQAKVAEARAEQERAAGRPEAARAMELAKAVRNAAREQDSADAARDDLTDGSAPSPLEAATAQQQAADATKSAEAAVKNSEGKPEAGTEELSQALNEAAALQAEAAKALVDGKAQKATEAAAKADAALDKAADLAEARAQELAKQTPAGKPDAKAQAKVTDLAEMAQQLAQQAGTDAAAPLAEAAGESGQAEKALDNTQADPGQMEAGKALQAETAADLARASEKLEQAREALAAQARQQLAEVARQADAVAEMAADVDPGANAATRDAEDVAADSAGMPEGEPADAARAQQAAQAQLARAQANLAAREQRVRRDKAIAQALAELAKSQQQAADEIAAQRAALEQLADANPMPADQPANDPADPGTPEKTPAEPARPAPSKEQRSAAEKLARATAQFAQAQDATGQGAEQVSGQEEVANMPLREALELASGLTPESFEALPMEAGDQPAGEAPAGEAPVGDQPAGDQPAGDQPAGSTPPTGNAPPKPSDLGQGFVPNSPKTTAQMMAGKEALQQLEQALGQPLSELLAQQDGLGEGQDPLAQADQPAPAGDMPPQPGQTPPGTPPPGQNPPANTPQQGMPTDAPTNPQDTPESNNPADKASDKPTKDGKPKTNPGVRDGALTKDESKETKAKENATANSAHKGDAEARKLADESWFAKLPQELRQAMRARAQRRAPKGYEERLERYFQSAD